jgi:hypothetical protein
MEMGYKVQYNLLHLICFARSQQAENFEELTLIVTTLQQTSMRQLKDPTCLYTCQETHAQLHMPHLGSNG